MERADALEVLSALSDSPHRLAILRFVGEAEDRGDEVGVAEVSSALDIPRATAKHNLSRLQEHDLVESVGSRYAVTPFGTSVRESVDACLAETMVSKTLLPFLEVVPNDAFDVDRSRFRGASVTTVSATNPHAPVERLLDRVDSGTYLRVATPVVLPRLARAIREHVVDRGYRVDLVVPPATVDALREELEGELAPAFETERLVVGVAPESVPFGLYCFEDAVVLAGHDDENIVRCVAEADSASACEWARERFRAFEQAAESYVWNAETFRDGAFDSAASDGAASPRGELSIDGDVDEG